MGSRPQRDLEEALGELYGYARASSTGQDLSTQQSALKASGCRLIHYQRGFGQGLGASAIASQRLAEHLFTGSGRRRLNGWIGRLPSQLRPLLQSWLVPPLEIGSNGKSSNELAPTPSKTSADALQSTYKPAKDLPVQRPKSSRFRA